MRSSPIAILTGAAALLGAALASAQLYGWRHCAMDDHRPGLTEVVTQRWHFGTNGRIGHCGWSHNYPQSEINLNEFVGRTTSVDVDPDSYRLLELSSPEIFEYPFAYISEPGEMEMTDAEVANLREYVDRGGFVLIDDFDGDHMDNLREEMLRVFRDREFRTTAELIVGGLVVGAVIVGGWYVSGHLGHLAEDPQTLEERFFATNSGRMESFSFVAPVADLLELLVLWTDQSRVLTFGIAGVLGMLAGSCAMALYTRTFRWEGFASVEDTANHIAGAVLMGFGGVTALGCTIGQGLTGISTLAVGSILTFLSIVGGCVLAVRYQEWRIDRMEAAVA